MRGERKFGAAFLRRPGVSVSHSFLPLLHGFLPYLRGESLLDFHLGIGGVRAGPACMEGGRVQEGGHRSRGAEEEGGRRRQRGSQDCGGRR